MYIYSLGETLLRVDAPSVEAGKIQHRKLNIQEANGGATPGMKIASDISSMISKQVPPMLLNFDFLGGVSFTLSGICNKDLYMSVHPPEVSLYSIEGGKKKKSTYLGLDASNQL